VRGRKAIVAVVSGIDTFSKLTYDQCLKIVKASETPIYPMSIQEFITHAFPSSVFNALASNEILQIVVFSVLFGSAAAALGEHAKLLVDLMDVAAHVMLKLTGYVMAVAPLAVYAALASTVAKDGLSILVTYGKFSANFTCRSSCSGSC